MAEVRPLRDLCGVSVCDLRVRDLSHLILRSQGRSRTIQVLLGDLARKMTQKDRKHTPRCSNPAVACVLIPPLENANQKYHQIPKLGPIVYYCMHINIYAHAQCPPQQKNKKEQSRQSLRFTTGSTQSFVRGSWIRTLVFPRNMNRIDVPNRQRCTRGVRIRSLVGRKTEVVAPFQRYIANPEPWGAKVSLQNASVELAAP